MKLTKTRLKQIIKEELQTALREEDDKVAAILSEFTPEEQDILRKDLISLGPNQRSLEDAVEMYLYNPDFGEDKIIEVMRLIVKYGSYDAVIAAEKKVKEEWARVEVARIRGLERRGIDRSRIYGETPPWQTGGRARKKAYPALAAQDLGLI